MRLPLLLCGVLALAACDVADPSDPPPADPATPSDDLPAALVGTWGMEAETLEAYVTSPTAQTYIQRGLTTDVAGSAELDGESVEFRFARLNPSETSLTAILTSYDPDQGEPSTGATARLTISRTGSSSAVAEVSFRTADGDQAYRSFSLSTQPVQIGVPTFELGPLTFSDVHGDGPPVVVQATATSPTVALPAGVRTRVKSDPQGVSTGPGGRPGLRYTFDAGGALRIERDEGAVTYVQNNTWSARDGVLRVSDPSPPFDDEVLRRYGYTVTASTLTLDFTRYFCDAPSCLASQAAQGELSAPISAYEEVTRSEWLPTEAPFLQAPTPATGDLLRPTRPAGLAG